MLCLWVDGCCPGEHFSFSFSSSSSLHHHHHPWSIFDDEGVLDGEVVSLNKETGEHEAFGHNKTVAICKVTVHPIHMSLTLA